MVGRSGAALQSCDAPGLSAGAVRTISVSRRFKEFQIVSPIQFRRTTAITTPNAGLLPIFTTRRSSLQSLGSGVGDLVGDGFRRVAKLELLLKANLHVQRPGLNFLGTPDLAD
jgi:hypothetical protein